MTDMIPFLQWPGGKFYARKILTRYIPTDLSEIHSPFLGGGSIELELASKGVLVHAYDIDPDLCLLWNLMKEDPERVADHAATWFPCDRTKYYWLRENFEKYKNPWQRAALYWVMNKTSFSGKMFGGFSEKDFLTGKANYNLSQIDKLSKVRLRNITIENLPFHESLKKAGNNWIYADPPYLLTNSNDALYGRKGKYHKKFQHDLLSQMLHKKSKWILSYNDVEPIRQMYADCRFFRPSWVWAMTAHKESHEVLICPKDLKLNRITDFMIQ